MSESRRQLERWLGTLEIEGSVIDIGGISLPVRNRTKNPLECSILDIREARKGVRTTYVRDLNLPIDDVPRHDVGFCLEVMQFLYDPLTALKNMRKMCDTLYINFHLFHIPCTGTDYLRYTEKGWRKLLEESGWNVAEVAPRGEEGWFVKAL